MEKQKERLNRNQIIERIIEKYREKFFSLIEKIDEHNKGLAIILVILSFFVSLFAICLLGGFIMSFGFIIKAIFFVKLSIFTMKALFMLMGGAD